MKSSSNLKCQNNTANLINLFKFIDLRHIEALILTNLNFTPPKKLIRIPNAYFLLLILIFNVSLNFSQSNFKPGYLITDRNDTIKGLIKAGSPHENAQQCVYKENSLSEIQLFYPNSIKAYAYNDGNFYISKEIPDSLGLKTVFLEFLIKGNLSIYLYMKTPIEYAYYAEKNGKLHELVNTKKP